jgi:hypothetical protein
MLALTLDVKILLTIGIIGNISILGILVHHYAFGAFQEEIGPVEETKLYKIQIVIRQQDEKHSTDSRRC